MKRKCAAWLLAIGLAAGLTGCGKTGETEQTGNTAEQAGVREDTGEEKGSETGITAENTAGGESEIYEVSDGGFHCSTENGYYYVTGDLDYNYGTLRDGTECAYIMYMDYATRQEVYLCSNTGCNHDTEDCTAVLTGDNVLFGDVVPFLYGGKLYILCKPYDNSGSLVTSIGGDDPEELVPGDEIPEGAVLYRMNPDGTQRETVYIFDAELKIGGMIFADESALYLETCEIEMEQVGENSTYYASANRRIMRLDLENKKLSEVYVFKDQGAKFGTWDVCGADGSGLFLTRTLYPSDFTDEDVYGTDDMAVYWEKYERSEDEWAFLDLSTGELTSKYRISNEISHAQGIKDGCLYMSFEDGRLVKVDLQTGEETVLLQDDRLKDGWIWNVYGEYLSIHTMSGLYLVDYNSGEISKTPLVDETLHWPLEIRAENSDSFLVIYAYDAVQDELDEESYEISQYKFALIGKEELFQGKTDYQPIQMVGNGEGSAKKCWR